MDSNTTYIKRVLNLVDINLKPIFVGAGKWANQHRYNKMLRIFQDVKQSRMSRCRW